MDDKYLKLDNNQQYFVRRSVVHYAQNQNLLFLDRKRFQNSLDICFFFNNKNLLYNSICPVIYPQLF